MEKINLSELLRLSNWKENIKQPWLDWLCLALLQDEPLSKFKAKSGDTILEVDLKVNGIDISLSNLVALLYRHFEHQVVIAAQGLIDERVEKAMELIESITEEFADKVKSIQVPVEVEDDG